ncbi:putative glycolipid-binding domain-containing protein [Rhodobacteraceae bacterium NNCM2]|nr:putative glycolipid-binding domain-containing protein [Coraliihabitans acroporae]
MDTASILWQRLDIDGRDACRFERRGDGWRLTGAVIAGQGATGAMIRHETGFGADWIPRLMTIDGWSGERSLALRIERDTDGHWSIDGKRCEAIRGCLDIDFGFTPATNTNAIRRLDLREGERAELTAAWLDISDWSLKPLRQSYQRIGPAQYVYRSANGGFEAELEVDGFGLVRHYPGLCRVL